MIELNQINTGYEVMFDYKPWLVDGMRLIPDARWNHQRKNWFIPNSSKDVLFEWLKKNGFKDTAPKPEVFGTIEPLPELEIEIPLKRTPYDYQKRGVAYAFKHKRVIVGDDMGLGKEQPLTSLIATPNGFIKMGETKVGMDILGADGKTHKILGVYPQGEKEVFKITFNDETTCECGKEHLWQVRDSNRRMRGKGWTVKTTQEILNLGVHYKPNAKRIEAGHKERLKWQIPFPEPFDFEDKEFLIHPYILGVLIGDGSMCGNTVCISVPDMDIENRDRVLSFLPDNMKLRETRYPSCPQYYIVQKKNTTNKNPFKEELKNLGLNVKSLQKFIPTSYMFGSKQQRLDLLRGLMDTDGSSNKNRINFHTCSESLAKDVSDLVFSLGGQAIIRTYDRTNENKSVEYQVNVRLFICPFYLKRKAAHWWISKRNYPTKYIKSIQPFGYAESQCIKVSAPDSLYLTDHFIVTHNTFQAVTTAAGSQSKCILVICPATLKENWVNEFKMNADWTAMEITDRIKNTWVQYYNVGLCKVFVVNYESLKKYFVSSIDKEDGRPLRLNHIHFKETIKMFDMVILDESHRLKNHKTLASKLCAGISKGKEYILALTGTPVQNKPADLWPQLTIIQQIDKFGGYRGFIDRYCDGKNNASNLKELNYLLNKHCFYRRLKRDVLKDLPPIRRSIYKVSINNREEYNKAENDFVTLLKENLKKTQGEIDSALRGQSMVMIGILKKLSAKGKLERTLEYIQEIIDSEEKIVVFCWHTEIVQEIKRHIPNAVTVVGSDSQEKRNAAVHDFQKCKVCNVRLENHKNVDHEHVPSDTNVIICNIKSGGVGITLTASSRVIHHELPWTAADCDQDESRCDRISQRNCVESGFFLGANTIDEYIYSIIESKRNIANQVTGVFEDVETNMVDEFIHSFMKDKM